LKDYHFVNVQAFYHPYFYSSGLDDCAAFYQCANGIQFDTMHCPDGLHFNPEFGVCDWPENVDCESGSTNPPEHLECIQACIAKGRLECIAGCLGITTGAPPTAPPTDPPEPEACEDGFHRVPGTCRNIFRKFYYVKIPLAMVFYKLANYVVELYNVLQISNFSF